MTPEGGGQPAGNSFERYDKAYEGYQGAKADLLKKHADKIKQVDGKPTLSLKDVSPEDREQFQKARDDLAGATDKMWQDHKAAGKDKVDNPTASCPQAKKEEPDKECPHKWREIQRETPEETQGKNSENAKKNRSKPSCRDATGPEFENKAIEANKKRIQIQGTSVKYQCETCGLNQEVDILGADRVVEAKSMNAHHIKNKSKQARRLKQIQSQLFGSAKPPMAKINGNMPDVDESAKIFQRRGFEVEILKENQKGEMEITTL